MKKALIGAGGFAREIMAHMGTELPCFVDDKYYNNEPNIFKLSDFNPLVFEVLVAIGDPKLRFDIIQRLPKDTKYFTFIHPSVLILDNNIEISEGTIVCAGTILTTNIKIGKHSHLNLMTTVGHDTIIGDYFTTAPGAKISGNCIIKDRVYIGTNASIKEKITITDDVVIGLNSGVVKSIDKSGVYVGTPTKQIK